MSERPFLAFLSGLGIGVGAGLLLAPKSGAETRARIKESVEDGQNYIRKQSGEIADVVTGTIERGKQAARRTTDSVGQTFEEGRTAFQKTFDRG